MNMHIIMCFLDITLILYIIYQPLMLRTQFKVSFSFSFLILRYSSYCIFFKCKHNVSNDVVTVRCEYLNDTVFRTQLYTLCLFICLNAISLIKLIENITSVFKSFQLQQHRSFIVSFLNERT